MSGGSFVFRVLAIFVLLQLESLGFQKMMVGGSGCVGRHGGLLRGYPGLLVVSAPLVIVGRVRGDHRNRSKCLCEAQEAGKTRNKLFRRLVQFPGI